jgi:hypothetical protein
MALALLAMQGTNLDKRCMKFNTKTQHVPAQQKKTPETFKWSCMKLVVDLPCISKTSCVHAALHLKHTIGFVILLPVPQLKIITYHITQREEGKSWNTAKFYLMTSLIQILQPGKA